MRGPGAIPRSRSPASLILPVRGLRIVPARRARTCRDYMESSEDALVGLRREKREAEAELRAMYGVAPRWVRELLSLPPIC